MRFVRLPFAGFEVDFVDREVGLEQFRGWAERGVWHPLVIYGPEGCGKSALLRQVVELLRDYDYSVALVSPMAESVGDRLILTDELRELAKDVLSIALGGPVARLIELLVEALYEVVRRSIRRRIALLLDDVFQAIGIDKAATLVKSLLNMIEHPSVRYERAVIVVTTSEGVTRWEIGRHTWATLMPIWNLPMEGFRRLYEQLPGDKPPFDDVWRWTGGNPRILSRLYEVGWDVGYVAESIMRERRLNELTRWRRWLECAIEDPDCLWGQDVPRELIDELVGRNLIHYSLYGREQRFWLDTPPPRKDPELGIGQEVAWQTPLHREAVRRALGL